MANDSRRNDLGDFLRARRAEVTPAAVGFPDGGARRVPGLRREEVAVLAAISTDYYARLEHGRMHATPAVLDSSLACSTSTPTSVPISTNSRLARGSAGALAAPTPAWFIDLAALAALAGPAV